MTGYPRASVHQQRQSELINQSLHDEVNSTSERNCFQPTKGDAPLPVAMKQGFWKPLTSPASEAEGITRLRTGSSSEPIGIHCMIWACGPFIPSETALYFPRASSTGT